VPQSAVRPRVIRDESVHQSITSVTSGKLLVRKLLVSGALLEVGGGD